MSKFSFESFKNKIIKDKILDQDDVIDLIANEETRIFVSTQIPAIDYVLGKGLPVGKFTEITGDYSSGKSLLATHLLAETIKQGGLAVLFENEASMDYNFMKNVGLDYSKLLHVWPKSLEDGYKKLYEFIQELQKAKKEGNAPPFTTIVWDSVSAAPNQSITFENEEKTDKKLAVSMKDKLSPATVHSNLLPEIIKQIAKTDILLVYINQLRDIPGVMYGDTEETMGGRAIKFYASVRMKFTKGKVIKEGDNPIGQLGSVKVTKNKVAPPLQRTETAVYYASGFDKCTGIEEVLLASGILVREGNSFFYRGKSTLFDTEEKLAVGSSALIERIRSDENLFAAIMSDIHETEPLTRALVGTDIDE